MRKKKFLSLLLTFAMMMCLMPIKIFGAGGVTLTITASSSTAQPGEDVPFDLNLDTQGSTIGSLKFPFTLSEGLIYKDSSFVNDNDMQAYFVTEGGILNTKLMGMVTNENGYNGTKKIATITYTVDNNAQLNSKELNINKADSKFFVADIDDDDLTLTVTSTPVTITAAPIDPDGVSLDETSITLAKGTSKDLTATITPPGATGTLNWSSSDSGKVKVNNGTVTAVEVTIEPVTITVSVQNTNNLSATCLVNVTECQHTNKTEIPAKAATCTEEGNNKYYYCGDCKKYFKDNNGAIGQETTVEEETISAGHVLTHHTKKDATCTKDGNIEYWSCSNGCGGFFSDAAGSNQIPENSLVIPAGHNLTRHEQKNATCTTDGNIEYWSCNGCGGFFSDAAGTNEILENSLVIQKVAHQFSSTYESDETQHWRVCNYGCGTEDRGNHTFGPVTYEWANDNSKCTAKHTCTVCGKKVSETVVPSAATTATCTQKGTTTYTATFTKEGLGTATKDVAVDALGHNFEWVVTKEVTDTEDGMMEEICSRCGEKRDEKVIPALGNGETKELDAYVTMNGQGLKLILQDPYEALPDGTKLVVNLAEPGSDRHNELSSQYDGQYNVENIAFFDINLLDLNDQKLPMPLSHKVRAIIQIPGGWDKEDLEAVLIASGADVEFEEKVVTIDGVDYLAFWTDHFSPYAMIDKLTDEEAAELAKAENSLKMGNGLKTGESLTEVYLSGLLLAAAILVIYLALKKRKEA